MLLVLCAGSSQQSSKAGFPWWGGLIIALVALVLIGALAGLACFARMHRRRKRRSGALEEAIHKQVRSPVRWCEPGYDGHPGVKP